MKHYQISLFGVKHTTQIIAEYLHDCGIQVDLIVSIANAAAQKNAISDYVDLESTARRIGADYYCAKEYSLSKLADNFFQENTFELGLVIGWQRLIPDAILAKFTQGVFGFHASPDLLPKGRGRSPLNWGIILGKTVLYNHLFRYVNAADAGDIYSVTPLTITPHDTIVTVMYKSLLIAKQEIPRLVQDVNAGTVQLTPQVGEPAYLLARTPHDGLLNFDTTTTQDLVNLIRGVTRPFPGAFCFTQAGQKIIIWEAWEFDSRLNFARYQPGDVIDTLYAMPIIKTIDGSLIIKAYEGAVLMPHDRLVSQS